MKNSKTSKKIRKNAKKTLPAKQKEGKGAVKSLLFGICVYILCTMGVSLVLSGVLVTLPDPDFLIFPCSMLAAAIGAIISGVVVRNMWMVQSLLSGVVTAISTAAITFALSLLPVVNRQAVPSFGKTVLFFVVALGSVLGAYIGGKKTARNRRRIR